MFIPRCRPNKLGSSQFCSIFRRVNGIHVFLISAPVLRIGRKPPESRATFSITIRINSSPKKCLMEFNLWLDGTVQIIQDRLVVIISERNVFRLPILTKRLPVYCGTSRFRALGEGTGREAFVPSAGYNLL